MINAHLTAAVQIPDIEPFLKSMVWLDLEDRFIIESILKRLADTDGPRIMFMTISTNDHLT